MLRDLPGWTWDLHEQRWLDQWTQVRAVALANGSLNLEDPAIADIALHAAEPKSRVNTVGRWSAWQRQQIRKGDLESWKTTKLREIPGFRSDILTRADAAAVMILAEYVAWKQDANAPANVVEDDVPLGHWLNTIRRRRATGHLTQTLHDEVVIITPSEGPGKLRWLRDETLWLLGLEALCQFTAREGHCRVPLDHTETLPDTTIALYQWCVRQRHTYRHGRLLPVRAQLVERVPGWQWENHLAPRVSIDIGDARHGERTGYVKGCRCTPCTRANAEKNHQRASRVAAGLPSTDWVDAGPARRHLQQLVSQGAGRRTVVRASGLSRNTITDLLSGTQHRILPETERAILAVGMPQVRAAIGGASLVDAGPTWQLLDDMILRGWPKSWIARELGLGTSLQLSRESVTASNAARVSDLHARLGSRVAPPRRGRQSTPSLNELLNTTGRPNADDRQAEAINWAAARQNPGKTFWAYNADDARVDDAERSA